MKDQPFIIRTFLRTGATIVAHPFSITITHHTPDEIRELLGSMGVESVTWKLTSVRLAGQMTSRVLDVETFIKEFDDLRRRSWGGN